MTSNIDIDEDIISKLNQNMFYAIEKYENIMDTDEYKDLFKMAKKNYPYEDDYFIHIACISYFNDKKSIDILEE